MTVHGEYDDKYPTCDRTWATLRVFSDDITADEMTYALGVEPTNVHVKGQLQNTTDPKAVIAKHHAWFLTTMDVVESKDARRHIDWLLDRVETRVDTFGAWRDQGVRADVFCFWGSARGMGGPTLSPRQGLRLGALGLSILFDVYVPKVGA